MIVRLPADHREAMESLWSEQRLGRVQGVDASRQISWRRSPGP